MKASYLTNSTRRAFLHPIAACSASPRRGFATTLPTRERFDNLQTRSISIATGGSWTHKEASSREGAKSHSYRPGFRVVGSGAFGASVLLALFLVAPNPGQATSSNTDEDLSFTGDPLDALLPSAFEGSLAHLAHHSNPDLLRSWLTYAFCESDLVVKYGPDMMEAFHGGCEKVPILGTAAWAVAEWFMRQTFIFQYAGGETPTDCLPVLDSWLSRGASTLFAYSVEGSGESSTKGVCAVSARHITATRDAIDVASKFATPSDTTTTSFGSALMPTSVAIKLSGLVTDPYLLKTASAALVSNGATPWDNLNGELFPVGGESGLSKQQAAVLGDLMQELRSLSVKAKEDGVRLVFDAEYTYFQPAIDRVTQVLSSEFNQHSPIIYHTFQCYLRSTPSRLHACISAADSNPTPFSTGIKLVRGAYLTAEPAYHRASGSPGLPPTWGTKAETDDCYDSLAGELVSRVAREAKGETQGVDMGVIVAGHNAKSIRMVLQRLRDEEGVAENVGRKLALADELRGRFMFGHLYGMADNLTTTLLELLTPANGAPYTPGTTPPFVLKYVPFGSPGDVMPYLGRRAQENQSILKDGSGRGGAKEERQAVGREMRRRMKALILGS